MEKVRPLKEGEEIVWTSRESVSIKSILKKQKMEKKYYNVSSVRVMRFLYALGFAKESYLTKDNKECWRFEDNDALRVALCFYKKMRAYNNGGCTYGERKE